MIKSGIYFAVYDIGDDILRESIVNILKNTGMSRIQKSVFCGMLNNQQRKDLLANIGPLICGDLDSFYLIMNCSSCFEKIHMVGKVFDKEYVSDQRPSMVF